jgi:hypothetical protein
MKYTANPVVVDAYRITEVGEPMDDGSRWITMDGNPISRATAEMMSRMTPVAGDYWVVQSDGYVYLNPKDVFERKYTRSLLPHQQRVYFEKKDLDDKLDKLKAFLDSSPIYRDLPEDERVRLNRQFDVMAEYSSILSQRIAAFKE